MKGDCNMLKWSEKLSLLMTKGLSWKEVQELDRGLDEEVKTSPKDNPKDDPKDDPKDNPKDDPKDDPKDKPTETEKKLLEKIESLEAQLKEAQADNVHGNNEVSKNKLSFDEQLNEMFKDIRI